MWVGLKGHMPIQIFERQEEQHENEETKSTSGKYLFSSTCQGESPMNVNLPPS